MKRLSILAIVLLALTQGGVTHATNGPSDSLVDRVAVATEPASAIPQTRLVDVDVGLDNIDVFFEDSLTPPVAARVVSAEVSARTARWVASKPALPV
eukprot:CAMPEP_0206033882 /NCGR_PEP_ID=MMETSP1466-20131121/972_1 /ASSEMBLY_ACC=CAM_ASM_001126 /TAXON_ID=44452 /ORGANISM="Pavlova gyrans, Strain CCMP608" /LENGTH=96 /DNA_ID=CAMNT_0053408119 /DNA_START=39 /DNA_END=330 /DNA_ORIENTATION=-